MNKISNISIYEKYCYNNYIISVLIITQFSTRQVYELDFVEKGVEKYEQILFLRKIKSLKRLAKELKN